MTTYYYGVDNGKTEYDAAVDTSTTSSDVEIVVSATNITTKLDLLLAIEKLENFITRQGYPPV